jgi:uncharacterized protein YraI
MRRPTFLAGAAAVLFVLLPGLAWSQAYTAHSSNVRAGPDIAYPLVATLYPNTLVDVQGCVAGYRWCDVIFDNGYGRGWIYAGNLMYPYATGPVPLLSYGTTIGVPVITFSLGNYWDRYYHDRPWYSRRNYWASRPVPSYSSSAPPARPAAPYGYADRGGYPTGPTVWRGENRTQAPPAVQDPSRIQAPGRPQLQAQAPARPQVQAQAPTRPQVQAQQPAVHPGPGGKPNQNLEGRGHSGGGGQPQGRGPAGNGPPGHGGAHPEGKGPDGNGPPGQQRHEGQ